MEHVAILGAGSWGSALGQLLAEKGLNVSLLCRREEQVNEINENHTNHRYLKDAVLSERIHATTSASDALVQAEACVFATPSRYLRETAVEVGPLIMDSLPLVICSKGVEGKSGLLASEILTEVLGGAGRICVLSGPTHAEEVVKGIPSGAVCASSSEETASFFQQLFSTDAFRTYTTDDIKGVELCGAFKNVIAIAVGISYGMGFGDNTAAMIITRGLAEMSRMVVACGGDALTCMGLAGAGDMVVTCMSHHSRNRRFGEEYLAKGLTLKDFEAQTHMVVEGAQACKTLKTLQERYGVDLPITDAVRAVIWEGASLRDEAHDLIDRPLKDEIYGLQTIFGLSS